MSEEPYRKLAQHLDRLPEGFPPSESGADLRLLQMLFTPEEADLATYLTLDREEASTIAERAGRPTAEVEGRLHEMAPKPEDERTQPPSDLETTWRTISAARAAARERG